MEFVNNRWYCTRHMSTKLMAHKWTDEGGNVHFEAHCPECLRIQLALSDELKMYHDMDARIRDLQNACIKVLSPEE